MERDHALEGQYREQIEALSSQFDRYLPTDADPEQLAHETETLSEAVFETGRQLAGIASISISEGDTEAGDVLLGLIGIDRLIADKAAALAVLFQEMPSPYVEVPELVRRLAHDNLIELVADPLDFVAPRAV